MALADAAGDDNGDGRVGHVLIAMGAPGVATRVLAAPLGNRWTYAGDSVAPGQLPPARLLRSSGSASCTPTRLFTASSASRSDIRARR